MSLDDPQMFGQIGLSLNQIIDFTYQISGTKTEDSNSHNEQKIINDFIVTGLFESTSEKYTPRIRHSTQSDNHYYISYNMVALASLYGAPKILHYIHDAFIMTS